MHLKISKTKTALLNVTIQKIHVKEVMTTIRKKATIKIKILNILDKP